jgi:iron complex transport system ATP-binding protein
MAAVNRKVLSLDHVSFAYHPEHPVLQDISFSLTKGEMLAVLGPNGCGKSTLLKLLCGLLRLQEGRVDTSCREEGDGKTDRSFAFVPQEEPALWAYTVRTMVLLGRIGSMGVLSRPSRRDNAAAVRAMELIGIEDRAEIPFNELSGGERRMVLIARALAMESEILVLDEATAALDLYNQYRVLNLLHRLCKEEGFTVIFSTHDPAHALSAADQALLFMPDRSYVIGAGTDILNEERIFRAYGIRGKISTVSHEGNELRCFVPFVKTLRSPRSGEKE